MKLARDERDELVKALLDCQSIAERYSMVRDRLPRDVQSLIPHRAQPLPQVDALLATCADFPRGLHELGVAVLSVEGATTYPMQRLGRLLLRFTLIEALFAICRDDPDVLRSFVSFNLGPEAFNTLPEASDIDGLARATVAAAESQRCIDNNLIDQMKQLAMAEDAHRDYLQHIADTWLRYAARPPATPVSPAPTPISASSAPRSQPQPRPRSAPARAPQPATSTSTSTSAPTTTPQQGPPSRISLTMDRLKQWGTLVWTCTNMDENIAFLIHGHRSQALHLFAARVQDYLSDACRPVHRVYQVPFRNEFTRANDPELWRTNLRRALGAGRGKTMGQVLNQAARHGPIMLILGNGVLYNLDDAESDALLRFLGEHLPRYIREAAALHPVRVLVPVAYDEATSQQNPLIQEVARVLSANPPRALKYAKLIDVSFPPWDEVRDYLRAEIPDASTAFLQRAHQIHQQLSSRQPPGTFLELTEALGQLIESFYPPSQPTG